MKIKTSVVFQTFNDGIGQIFEVRNQAEAGDKPEGKLELLYGRVPYERRTAGVTRIYYASLEGVEISGVIRIPKAFRVSNHDACQIGGDLYEIRSVQEVTETIPPAQDLALRKVESIYDVTGI